MSPFVTAVRVVLLITMPENSHSDYDLFSKVKRIRDISKYRQSVRIPIDYKGRRSAEKGTDNVVVFTTDAVVVNRIDAEVIFTTYAEVVYRTDAVV